MELALCGSDDRIVRMRGEIPLWDIADRIKRKDSFDGFAETDVFRYDYNQRLGNRIDGVRS